MYFYINTAAWLNFSNKWSVLLEDKIFVLTVINLY